jgi:hypothetical protein
LNDPKTIQNKLVHHTSSEKLFDPPVTIVLSAEPAARRGEGQKMTSQT